MEQHVFLLSLSTEGATIKEKVLITLLKLSYNKNFCFNQPKCIFEVETINNHYNYIIFFVKKCSVYLFRAVLLKLLFYFTKMCCSILKVSITTLIISIRCYNDECLYFIVMLSVIILNVVTLNAVYAECCYAKCCNAESQYAECRDTEFCYAES